MTIEEQHKDYSNEQLINAISNTLVALDRQSHRVNALNHQMAEFQNSLNKAYMDYKQLQDELAKHFAQVENAQKALDNLRESMDGYSKALTARVNQMAGV